MKILYLIATIFLIINFLRYKKSTKELSLILWIIYSLGLLLCYNITIVFALSYIGIKSSFLLLSIISIIIAIILLILSKKNKLYQRYYFNKTELISVLVVIFISLAIGLIRFNGLTEIHYESGDSAIHYRGASYFAREHQLLTVNNTNDIMYKNFRGTMCASYINGGLVIDLLSFMKPYFAFILFDILCLVLGASLFLITCFKLLEKKDNKYLYCVIMSILYLLGFPLNNMLFGFYYLGIGIILINLLLYTILSFDEELNKSIIFKAIIIAIINFGVFNSYYLFMPPVYLALGIYYIYNYLKKNITKKDLFFYGIITLIIPFIIGFLYYIFPSFFDNKKGNTITNVQVEGYIYQNILALLLFGGLSFYILVSKPIKEKILSINYYCLVGYILLFLLLIVLKLSGFYYFFKLFFLFSLFMFLILTIKLYNKQIFVNIFFIIVLLSGLYILIFNNNITSIITPLNIYNWNIDRFNNGIKILNSDELDLILHSKNYKNECLFNNEFLLADDNGKNLWYYSITDMIPMPNHIDGFGTQLQHGNIKFSDWVNFPKHKCIIYFYPNLERYYYDNGRKEKQVSLYKEDLSNYRVLYENKVGVILKK